MKKRILSVLLMVCLLLTLMPTFAFATGGTTASKWGNGLSISFDDILTEAYATSSVAYEVIDGITTAVVTVEVDPDALANSALLTNILAQNSGATSYTGTIYGETTLAGVATAYPDATKKDTETSYVSFSDVPAMDAGGDSSTSKHWPYLMKAMYFDSATNTWTRNKALKDSANASIGQQLVSNLGLTDAAGLVYGTNYKFVPYIGTAYNKVYFMNAAGDCIGTEQYKIVYKVKQNNIITAAGLVAAIDSAQSGDTVKLGADVTNDGLIQIDKSITLDLGEKKLTNRKNSYFGSTADKQTGLCVTGGSVTIKNGSLDAGENTGIPSGKNSYALFLGGTAALTIENVTTNGGFNLCGASALVKDCTVTATNFYAICAQSGCSVTVNGGTYAGNSNFTLNTAVCALGEDKDDNLGKGSITIESGSFSGKLTATHADAPVETTNLDYNGVISISGGTFSVDPTEYLVQGYTVTGSSGTWTVNGPVATITANGVTTNYATLVEAVAAVPANGTITLLRDSSGSGIGTFANTESGTKIGVKNFTLDFGGHTYTCTGPAVGSAGTQSQAFHLEKGAAVTLKNGKIQATEASDGLSVKMLIQNYCDLTLDNMILDGSKLIVNNIGFYTLSNNNGTVTIKDTKIIAHETVASPGDGNIGAAFAFDVDYKTAYPDGAHVTVSGNSEIVGAIEVTPNTGSSLVISGGAFTDLANAIKYAQSGATIKLAADVTIPSTIEIAGDKTLTLDLNGKTVTSPAEACFSISKGAAVTVKNGTFSNVYRAFYVGGNTVPGCNAIASQLTVQSDVTITVADKGSAIFIEGKGAKLDFYGKIDCGEKGYYAIVGNGTKNTTQDCGGTTINIYAGSEISGANTPIYHPQSGNLNVSGGTITGGTGIEIRSGNLTVTGGIISGDGTYMSYPSGNGTSILGVGIGISQHATDQDINVNISGGNISGAFAVYEEDLMNTASDNIHLSISGGNFSVKNGSTIGTNVENGSLIGRTPGKPEAVYSENCTDSVTGGAFSDLSGLAYTPSGRTYTLNANTTVAYGKTVTIPVGVTLTIPSGTALTNNGTIVNAGVIINNGAFNNYGTFQGSPVVNATGAASVDVADVKTEVAAAKEADVTSDAGKAAVKNAVAAVVEVPSEKLNDAATLENLAALEEKLTQANTNISSAVVLPTDETKPDEAIQSVAVQNAALSVDPAVSVPTEAKVTITKATGTPTDVRSVAGAGVGQTIPADAKIMPIEIDLTINDNPQQPKAPLVIKLQVNMTAEEAAKSVIVHYLDVSNTQTELIRPSVVTDSGKVYLAFSTNSLSQFVVVSTPEAVNPNAYEFTLTPAEANVNAGGKVNYTVTLKKTAGFSNTDTVQSFRLTFSSFDSNLSNPSFAAAAGYDSVIGKKYNTNGYQLYFAPATALTVGTTDITLGTLSFDVAANVDDMTALTLTPDSTQTVVNNPKYSKTASVNVTVGDVSVRVVTLTFKGDGDTVLYQKYGVNGLYSNAACTISAAAPTLTATSGYELLDNTWTTAGGADYDASAAYTTSMVFLRNQGKIQYVTVPANVTMVSGITGTGALSDPYYVVQGQAADVVFSVAPATGMKVKSVSYTVAGGTAQTLTASGDNYTIPAASFTGDITINVEYNVDIKNVRVFTETAAGITSFVKFCAYSGSDTLVLIDIAVPSGKTLKLTPDGSPTIYRLEQSPYTTSMAAEYLYAVLLPSETVTEATAAAMKNYLLANTTLVDGEQPTATYNYNTNNYNGPSFEDVNAAYDFMSWASDSGWHWSPTDDLLLIADVLNYSDGTYTLGTANANGKLTAADISVFLYEYAGIPTP